MTTTHSAHPSTTDIPASWPGLADQCEAIARALIAGGMPEAQAIELAADHVIAGLAR